MFLEVFSFPFQCKELKAMVCGSLICQPQFKNERLFGHRVCVAELGTVRVGSHAEDCLF